MAFDRAGAKAAGYSDAEIDAFLSTGQEPAASPASQGGGMVDIAGKVAAGALGVGAVGLGAKFGVPAAGRVINQMAREPGLIGAPARIGRALVGKPGRPGADAVFPPAPPDATMPPPVVEQPPPMPQASPDKNWHTLTDRDVAKIPAFKNFEPGDPIRRSTYENAVMKSAQEPKGRGASPPSSYQRQGNPTRPIAVDREPARAPAPTPESPGAGRGASKPELARRAASRAKSVGRASASVEGQDLEALLGQSSELETRAKQAGLNNAERESIRQLARSGGIKGFGKSAGSLGMALGIYEQVDPKGYAKLQDDLFKSPTAKWQEFLKSLEGFTPHKP